MEEKKSLLLSKTFWGSVIAGLAGLGGIFGVDVTGAEQEAIVNGIAAIGVAIGTVVAIIGRMKAGKKIG